MNTELQESAAISDTNIAIETPAVITPATATVKPKKTKDKEEEVKLTIQAGSIHIDATALNHKLAAISSLAGRVKVLAKAEGLGKEMFEVDGGINKIIPPTVTAELVRRKKMTKEDKIRVDAYNKIISGLNSLFI